MQLDLFIYNFTFCIKQKVSLFRLLHMHKDHLHSGIFLLKCYNFCNPDQDLEYNAPTVLNLTPEFEILHYDGLCNAYAESASVSPFI